MKRYCRFLVGCFLCVLCVHAQPGPQILNLNDGFGDIIIIDSTTDVSRIETLKQRRQLSLIILLSEIPVEFKDFTQLESLTITPPSSMENLDVYFPNLKHLTIRGTTEKYIAKKKFKLDSLRSLHFMYSENLENIDAFLNCKTIEKLQLRGTPNLTQFPKFHRKNNIKDLVIDHVSTFRKKEAKDYLKAIQRLSKLERLTLANIHSLTEIPSYLPKSIQELKISGWASYDHRIRIQSLKHLKKYTNLKSLSLDRIKLEPVQETFPEIFLESLFLRISDLQDVSWMFSFGAIAYVKLDNCNALTTIHAGQNADVISQIDIRNLHKVASIDALFNLHNLQSLEVRNCRNLFLPAIDRMSNIPDIMLSGRRYHLYKKDGVWQKIEHY